MISSKWLILHLVGVLFRGCVSKSVASGFCYLTARPLRRLIHSGTARAHAGPLPPQGNTRKQNGVPKKGVNKDPRAPFSSMMNLFIGPVLLAINYDIYVQVRSIFRLGINAMLEILYREKASVMQWHKPKTGWYHSPPHVWHKPSIKPAMVQHHFTLLYNLMRPLKSKTTCVFNWVVWTVLKRKGVADMTLEVCQ